jgi:hypothetical protein
MIDATQKAKLIRFGQALIDQRKAHILIHPLKPQSGFWFGSGKLIEDRSGAFYLTGRYRSYGDSRTGLGSGARGLELAIFESRDRGKTFTKVLSFSKQDLSFEGQEVLSIEGSALHFTEDGVELFVSSEKANLPYPAGLEAFRKPGTGVWTIERLAANTVRELREAEIHTLLQCSDPRFLHVKDPRVYDKTHGDTLLVFCTHPFSWTSSNSAYTLRPRSSHAFAPPVYDFFPRGFTWDIAISRITCLLKVPQIGALARAEPMVLAFYDGGESVRNYDQHAQAVKRPRGYSCEEIGGLAWAPEEDLAAIERLSVNLPLFVSPMGTGCSRYVDVLQTQEGFYATWQQSQPDLSQPLVMNFVRWEQVEAILS